MRPQVGVCATYGMLVGSINLIAVLGRNRIMLPSANVRYVIRIYLLIDWRMQSFRAFGVCVCVERNISDMLEHFVNWLIRQKQKDVRANGNPIYVHVLLKQR